MSDDAMDGINNLNRRNWPPVGRDGIRHWPADADMITASAPAVAESDEIFSKIQEDVLGRVIAELRHEFATALDRRDREIKALNQRLDVEVALDRKLTTLKNELDHARERQPDFESELSALRKQYEIATVTIARLEKQVLRLRGDASGLRFSQEQTSKEVGVMTRYGAKTREALESLRANTLDLMDEMDVTPSRTN